ncbi:MAG TPA: hypothetical protein VG963_32565, partial [Polyangiaceae bacterium]|nr:hypothetical protein [Polyangiaceae bacterium]
MSFLRGPMTRNEIRRALGREDATTGAPARTGGTIPHDSIAPPERLALDLCEHGDGSSCYVG